MFREERYVKINSLQLSKNGFKNLSFETSRFSDSFGAIRGFGAHLNEKNLNIVDTFSIEFLIDYTELKEFALVYAMFKALGALPLENEYILNKISSVLSYKKLIKELENDESNIDKYKKINSLIVLLERIEITSLEETNNGYSINLVLTLLKDGFSETQKQRYTEIYNEWNKNIGFTKHIEGAIVNEISNLKNDGSLEIQLFNIEELNALSKNQIFNNLKTENIKDENEQIEKEELLNFRYNNLREFENLKNNFKIVIPNVNIGQIQLITYNMISNVPIAGDAIGNKNYLGIGRSALTVKMIFDEKDSVILDKLKELSDVNITKHKIKIKTALANLFDFKTGVITNVFFENSEGANGVIVSLKIELNAYDFFDSNNKDLLLEMGQIKEQSNNLNITGYLLETISEKSYREIATGTPPNMEIRKMFDTVLETAVFNSKDKNIDVGTSNNAIGTTVFNNQYKFIDFIGAYSSSITGFGKHKSFNSSEDGTAENSEIFKTEVNFINPKQLIERIKLKNTETVGEAFVYNSLKKLASVSLNKSHRVERDLLASPLYRFIDFNSYSLLQTDEQVRIKVQKVYEKTNRVTNTFSKQMVEDTVNRFFNEKKLAINLQNTMFLKTLYRQYFFDYYKIINSSPLIKEIVANKKIILSDGINYNKIHELIRSGIVEMTNTFNVFLNNDIFIKDVISIVLSEYSKGRSNEGINFQLMEEFLETFIKEIQNEFKLESSKINEITEKTYLIFLTKLTYSFSMLNLSGYRHYISNGEYELNKILISDIIKSHMISSITLGFLSIRLKYRTDSLGYTIKSGADIIGNRIANAFYLFKNSTRRFSVDGASRRYNDVEIFNEYFENYNQNSYFKDKVFCNFFEEEKNKIKEINKDFNFFYGKRINTTENKFLIEKIFQEEIGAISSHAHVVDFLNKEKLSFEKGEKYSDKIEGIKYNFSNLQVFYPGYYNENLFLNTDNKINSVMKKRLLGNRNVFKEMEELSKLISTPTYNVIPDYEIVLKKIDFEMKGVTGITNNEKVTSNFILKNVVSLRINYDPETKIKTLNLNALDEDKKILRTDKNEQITVQLDHEGKISIYTIEPGDYIEVRINNNFENKKVFSGTINNIISQNNIINIIGVNLASTFYSNKIREVNLYNEGVFSKTKNFIATILRRGSSDESMVDPDSFNNILSSKTCNNHLFTAFKNNFNLMFEKKEKASFFNATIGLLATLPRYAKSLLNGEELSSGALAMDKLLKTELNQLFGSFEELDDPRNRTSTTNIYKNIFNVDKDYDTYGCKGYGDSVFQQNGENLSTEYKEKETSNTRVENIEKNIKEEEEVKKYEEEEKNKNNQYEENEIIKNDNTFSYPCKSRRITSKFSLLRKHPVTGKTVKHNGLDIGAIKEKDGSINDIKNKIYACKDGTVIFIDSKGSTGMGKYIKIKHTYKNNGKEMTAQTIYGHLKAINVKKNQIVQRGETIGIMGTTGKSTGVHIHLEIHINNVIVDPEIFLK